MSLPPGAAPIPVAGITEPADPELAKAASELNAWITYLMDPNSNDGPRIYRDRSLSATGESDSEFSKRVEPLDSDAQYEAVSVLRDFAGDLDQFFRPVQAIAGVKESTIESTYLKLTEGCFTYTDKNRKADSTGERNGEPVTDVRYPELHPARMNWMQMRKSWYGKEDTGAHEFENDYIAYSVYTENLLYLVATSLVRYRAIFKKAGEDMTKLMNALMERFGRRDVYDTGGPGLTFDWKSIAVTAIVTVVGTVITGGAAAPVMIGLATSEIIGEAVKTGQAGGGKQKHLELGNADALGDIAKKYLEEAKKIENEVAEAITELYSQMRNELEDMREKREYQAKPTDSGTSMWVPHYKDYIEA
jgi:hypothetical protein